MPFSCAASSASAICVATSSASSIGAGPRFTRSPRSSPVTSSKLQGQEGRAVRLFEPVDGGDVAVVEGGEQLRLPPEAREALGIAGHLRGQHLDGHVAPELRVRGAVHLAHPPAPRAAVTR
jgi:hypothetical protein